MARTPRSCRYGTTASSAASEPLRNDGPGVVDEHVRAGLHDHREALSDVEHRDPRRALRQRRWPPGGPRRRRWHRPRHVRPRARAKAPPTVATRSAHQRAARQRRDVPGRPGPGRTERSISGQVVSISQATPSSADAPIDGTASASADRQQDGRHDHQRVERHGEQIDDGRDERDAAEAADQHRRESDRHGELQPAISPRAVPGRSR